MSRPRSLQPAYCLHRRSGNAFVKINGRQIFLGKHGTPASRDAYQVAVGEWIAQGRPAAAPPNVSVDSGGAGSVKPAGITIAELVDAYWTHAQDYYKPKPNRSTGELALIRMALHRTSFSARCLSPTSARSNSSRSAKR